MKLNLNTYCSIHQKEYQYYRVENEITTNNYNLTFYCDECLENEAYDNYPELINSSNGEQVINWMMNEQQIENLRF